MEFHGYFFMDFEVPIPDRIPWNLVSVELHGISCPNTRQNSMENFPSNTTEFHAIPWGYFIVLSCILRGG